MIHTSTIKSEILEFLVTRQGTITYSIDHRTFFVYNKHMMIKHCILLPKHGPLPASSTPKTHGSFTLSGLFSASNTGTGLAYKYDFVKGSFTEGSKTLLRVLACIVVSTASIETDSVDSFVIVSFINIIYIHTHVKRIRKEKKI